MRQFISEGEYVEYLTSAWNWFDIIWLTLTPTVIILSLQNDPTVAVETLRMMAALSSFALMVALFSWLRLFHELSFYILLITETLWEIKEFMLLLLVTLMMFGMPMIMLSYNAADENAELIDGVFSFWLSNMLVN